jgi:hypothetical protein
VAPTLPSVRGSADWPGTLIAHLRPTLNPAFFGQQVPLEKQKEGATAGTVDPPFFTP